MNISSLVPAEKKSALYAFLASFLILSTRGYQRILHADLWAEDGLWFVQESLEQGWVSIFTKGAGYYQIVGRTCVWALTKTVPLVFLPHAMTLVCIFFVALVFSCFASNAYAWILPKQKLRYLVILLFCLTPGLNEMLGNFCNLPWLFFYYLCFICLKDPTLSLSKKEIAFSVLALFSTGTAILLVPLLAYRLYLRRKYGTANSEIFLFLLTCCLVVWISLTIPKEWTFYEKAAFSEYYRVYIRSLAQSAFFQPIFGDKITYFLMGKDTARITVAIVIILSLLYLKWIVKKKFQTRSFPLALLLLSVSIWPVLAAWTRPNIMWVWFMPPQEWFFTHRYAFPITFCAVLFWMTFLTSFENKISKLFLAIFILCYVSAGIVRFHIPPYGPERRWAKTVDTLQQSILHKTPQAVTITTYPDGWSFTYDSKP